MHQALAIPGLFNQILQYCSSDPATVARLARTCHSLNDSSLTCLYGTQDVKLTNLVQSCMPEFFREKYYIDSDDEESREGICLRYGDGRAPASKSSWDRYYYYSAKVKSLDISASEFVPEVFLAIAVRHHARKTISSKFPFHRLESLSVTDLVPLAAHDLFNTIFLPFLGKSLRRLHISTDYCRCVPLLRPWKWAISATCPNVDELRVYHRCTDEIDGGGYHCDPLSDIILQTQRWTVVHFDITEISTADLHYAFSLPHLRRISLEFEELTDDNYASSTAVDKNLGLPGPPLERLYLCTRSEIMPSVIAMIAGRSINDISIHSIISDDLEDCQRVIQELAAHCVPDALETMNIGMDTNGWVDIEDIEPLFIFKGLKHLYLVIDGLCLDDEDLRSVAQSWEQLQTLTIVSELDGGQPSLYSLVYFAIFCPDLKDLELKLDLEVFPKLQGMTDVDCATRSLRSFVFGTLKFPRRNLWLDS